MIGHLSIGANLGDRRAALQRAADRLPELGVRVTAASSVYDTDPVGEVLDQPTFLNAALAIETSLEPLALLNACKAVEVEAGRDLHGRRHGPRPLDVDVVLLGDRVVDHERLVVPHPAALERRFVLVPLLELDLDLTTPDGTRLADALAALAFDEGVRLHGPPLAVVR